MDKFFRKEPKCRTCYFKIKKDQETLGYFVGLIIRKFGVKILGNPFEGWLTPDMGFIGIEKSNISDALRSVVNYAFKYLRCIYIQITDKNISINELEPDISYTVNKILSIDIIEK